MTSSSCCATSMPPTPNCVVQIMTETPVSPEQLRSAFARLDPGFAVVDPRKLDRDSD